MGIMCRKRLPLAKQYWKDVDVVDKETIYKHILDFFDMGLSQTHVKECVDDFLKESFRQIRFSLHQQYRSIAPGLSKRGNSPDWVTQDVWEVLCDRFESEKFQIRSMKNKDNREQEVINHRCGSRSLVRHKHAQEPRNE